MNLKVSINYFLFLLCFSEAIIAQESYSFQAGINSGYGFILTHSPGMRYITAQHIEKYDTYFEKNTFGTKTWHKRYNFPQIGLALAYFKLNNPHHLGNGLSLSPYLKFKLNKNQSFQIKLKTALGLGYLSKKFHPTDNFKNNAIGSHFNLFFSICLGAYIPINKQINLTLATNFSHFSNSAFSKPNLGINVPTIEGGLAYNFGPKQTIHQEEDMPFKQNKAYWQLTTSFGLNEIYPPNGRKYLATTFSLGREKKLNYKSTIGAAVDFFYNPAQRIALQQKDINVKPGWENLQNGLSLYHILHFGKLGVITQAGYYLKTKDKELGYYYHVVGGRVHLNRGVNIFFSLKTHFAKAEYLTLGINYHLNNE